MHFCIYSTKYTGVTGRMVKAAVAFGKDVWKLKSIYADFQLKVSGREDRNGEKEGDIEKESTEA